MEFPEEVNGALGAENVKMILDELKTGRLHKEKLKMIALKMEGSVHGKFIEKTRDNEIQLDHVLKYMLDVWYKEELYKTGKGLNKFMAILKDEDIKLEYLAEKMMPKPDVNGFRLVLKEGFEPEKYTLDRNDDETFLGSGSFGDVYSAALKDNVENAGFPQEVAVKIITWNVPAAKGYEETEWKLLEKGLNFTHDNLIQMFFLSVRMGKRNMRTLQIFMEMCEETLHDYTDRETVSLDDIKHVTVGVLKGLDHLHQQNIIHRDLKPQNILLKKTSAGSTSLRDMTIKLSDFNVSKWLPQRSDATNTPRGGEDAFSAPEVLLSREDGKTRYGTSCDIWALGALVFQLREKKAFAHEGEIRSAQLSKLIESKVKTVSETDVQSFLMACLNTNPKERYTTEGLLNHILLKGV